MPSAAAPSMSPCSASRLRSRQVIWKIGSMPACTRKCAAARLERCTLAPAPSVTLIAVTSPFSGSARRRNSAGSVETGGVISAVTTNWPLRSLDCSRDIRTDLIIGIRPTCLFHARAPRPKCLSRSLDRLVRNQRLVSVRLFNPFLLRTAVPPIGAVEGKRVRGLRRIGKRIVFALEDDLFLVLHLMIAGRLHWPGKKTRSTLALLRVRKRHAFAHRGRQQAARFTASGSGRGGVAGDGPGRHRATGSGSGAVRIQVEERKPHPQARPDRPAPLRRHRQRLLRRDPAPREALADRADQGPLDRGRGAPVPFDQDSPAANGSSGCAARASPRKSPPSARRWRCTAATASRARCAARRCSASSTPRTRPITARAARPAAGSSPTARSPACSRRAGRGRSMNCLDGRLTRVRSANELGSAPNP